MGRTSPGEGAGLSSRLSAAVRADPTYAEIGATLEVLPDEYRHVRRWRRIGSGEAAFDSAAGDLLRWQVHRHAGLGVEATDASAVLGSTVVLQVRLGFFRIVAPCRVVAIVDEPRRRGFSYGTLPGRPEFGEELFEIARGVDDEVEMRIIAFSRPSTWWAKIADPLTRHVQDLMTDRYLGAAEQS